jgi:hypothetical protein
VHSFATFPWPTAPSEAAQTEIERLARAIDDERHVICAERQIGLTRLYNAVEEGAYTILADLHAELDLAVGTAYGWPSGAATDPEAQERRLLTLNAEYSEVGSQPT